jgi:hypothetical protein
MPTPKSNNKLSQKPLSDSRFSQKQIQKIAAFAPRQDHKNNRPCAPKNQMKIRIRECSPLGGNCPNGLFSNIKRINSEKKKPEEAKKTHFCQQKRTGENLHNACCIF